MASALQRAWNTFRQLGRYRLVVRLRIASGQITRFIRTIATVTLWFALFGGVFLTYVMAPLLLLAIVPLAVVGYLVIRRLFGKPT